MNNDLQNRLTKLAWIEHFVNIPGGPYVQRIAQRYAKRAIRNTVLNPLTPSDKADEPEVVPVQNPVSVVTPLGMAKTAARAWKLREITDTMRSRLTGAGILNYEREAAGLAKGNDELIKKLNIDLAPRGDSYRFSTAGTMYPGSLNGIRQHMRFFNIPVPRKGRDAVSDAYLDASFLRHEINEAKAFRDIRNSLPLNLTPDIIIEPKNKHRFDGYITAGPNGVKALKGVLARRAKETRLSSHLKPSVLMHDSQIVNVAPDNARRTIMNLRRGMGVFSPHHMSREDAVMAFSSKGTDIMSEAAALEDLVPGFRFGGPASQKQMRQADKVWRSRYREEV